MRREEQDVTKMSNYNNFRVKNIVHGRKSSDIPIAHNKPISLTSKYCIAGVKNTKYGEVWRVQHYVIILTPTSPTKLNLDFSPFVISSSLLIFESLSPTFEAFEHQFRVGTDCKDVIHMTEHAFMTFQTVGFDGWLEPDIRICG